MEELKDIPMANYVRFPVARATPEELGRLGFDKSQVELITSLLNKLSGSARADWETAKASAISTDRELRLKGLDVKLEKVDWRGKTIWSGAHYEYPGPTLPRGKRKNEIVDIVKITRILEGGE